MQYYGGVVWKIYLRRAFGKVRRMLGVSPHMNQGSNILANPPSTDNDHIFRYRKYIIQSVRLADLVLQVAREHRPETIVVKLDIEGAEFEVLQDLFETEAASKISQLHVEFHERFFPGKIDYYTQLRSKLLQQASQYPSLQLHTWH
jgi:hypothetical protein